MSATRTKTPDPNLQPTTRNLQLAACPSLVTAKVPRQKTSWPRGMGKAKERVQTLNNASYRRTILGWNTSGRGWCVRGDGSMREARALSIWEGRDVLGEGGSERSVGTASE